MLSTAIVIFREALEIAVILGAVLAATSGLKGRLFWIIGGLTGGIFGASLVAVFTRSISSAISGMGQEVFNASILFTAALFIGWTVLWMRKHAREMTAHLKKVGTEVAEGKLPLYSLSLIIGLATLREGSEIVLFIYGMALSGQTAISIIFGSIIGFALGTTAGVMLYYGLITISAKYMFQVTSWILILLVAGLSSQGVSFLQAAGYFSSLSKPLWDTSWLLSEGSIGGKALHSLIGYSAKPTGAQLICYVTTLVGLISTIVLTERRRKHAVTVAAMVAVFLLLDAAPAFALDKIYSPYVTKGEWEVEYRGSSTFDSNHDKNGIQSHQTALGYSPTDYWATELYSNFVRDPESTFHMEGLEWENRFQLTEPGKYWMDFGLLASYIYAHERTNADALETKLLVEKDIGKFINIANIGFEQEVGSHAHSGPDFELLANSRYKYSPYLQPGIELQSNLGTAQARRHFENQEYYLGPAIYGQLPLQGLSKLKYELAYLAGLTDATSQSAIRLLVEYEFRL